MKETGRSSAVRHGVGSVAAGPERQAGLRASAAAALLAAPTRSATGRPRKDRFAVATMLALAEVRGLAPVDATVQRRPAVPEPAAHRRPASAIPSPVPVAGLQAAGEPSPVEAARTAIRAAHRQLSPDGQLVLAALADKIERQMATAGNQVKTELTLFAASTLLKKERAEGPVVLSAAQHRAMRPSQPATTAPPGLAPARRLQPGGPRLSW
ncbi:hypothetical protein [Azospirillum picis]|uniref:Uncharacterized protein n=1 Tax=Azospirillum picis TaxID=488438 RepID=A0ABU0MU49_9PROT|nr:hypothetical protein [Azospirillum picis]MBP2300920.1 hypothetical protein [Azospirillum picis]MDQ0537024.1 hypothetical protein [Azospirillum picis]